MNATTETPPSTATLEALTNFDIELLQYIAQAADPPSYRDLREHVGWKGDGSVRHWLIRMGAMGLVTRPENTTDGKRRDRDIRLTAMCLRNLRLAPDFCPACRGPLSKRKSQRRSCQTCTRTFEIREIG
jgi:hypothetical protein